MRTNRSLQWENPPEKTRRMRGKGGNQSRYIPALVKVSKHPDQWARIELVTVKSLKEKTRATARISAVGRIVRKNGYRNQPIGNWDVIVRSPEPNVVGMWVRFTPRGFVSPRVTAEELQAENFNESA